MGGGRASSLPTGTVTFLFTDIEGSTRLAQQLDVDTYRRMLEQHHALLRAAFEAHGGAERGTQGDAFLVIFTDAASAVAAAVAAQRALREATWPTGADPRVRMGLHTGLGVAGGDDYVGPDINRAARIAGAAHGGQILLSEATRVLAERRLPAGLALVDVGLHRLKDLDAPERLAEVRIDGWSPAPGMVRSLGVATNLPGRQTSFVGRDELLAHLTELLAGDRLVTVVGPGGVGKTSLAIEAARAAAPTFGEGAWFVALESLTEPARVADAVAAGLGLRDDGAQPARDRLLANLAGRSLLLVLDNFEQVIEAAPLVGDIVAGAPGVTVLVTSRTPLHLSAEQRLPVSPLPVPDAGDPARSDVAQTASIRLLVDRVRRADPGFAVTTENAATLVALCAGVDGLPLAIELVAAQVPYLGADGVLKRLDRRIGATDSRDRDRPDRQRSLAATIAWSHDLLDRPAQKLFARLAVFVGGFRLDQLDAVADGELGTSADEALAVLADHSLVTTTPAGDGLRFGMLETIRAFARERLNESPDASAVHERHAQAYLELVENVAAPLPGRGQPAILARLAEEQDNIRAAIRWSLDVDRAEIGQRFASAFWRFWQLQGQLHEGRATVDAILALPSGQAPTVWRARALEAAGGLAYWAADVEPMVEHYGQMLALAHALEDRALLADAYFNSSFLAFAGGSAFAGGAPLAAVGDLVDKASDLYRELGDERGLARLDWIRPVLLLAGGADEGRRALEEVYQRHVALDDLYYQGIVGGYLAGDAFQRGDVPNALRWSAAWLEVSHELGDFATLVRLLEPAVEMLLNLGRPVEAMVVQGARSALSRRYGMASVRAMNPNWIQDPVAAATDAASPEVVAVALERGHAMDLAAVTAYLADQIAELRAAVSSGGS
jgi:predicted ATPase/class 3 adenylate cyclase